MVFGINPRVWQRRYAWWPVRLIDGRRAWLEPIEVTGFVKNPEIEPGTPFNCRLGSVSFCARLPKTHEAHRTEVGHHADR